MMCDTTQLYAWHDSFTCVTHLNHVRDTTHSRLCGMTRSYARRDACMALKIDVSFTCVTRMDHVTGWRRPIGCLTFRGHFPHKSPMISCSFPERDLQLETSSASLLPCSDMTHSYVWHDSLICVTWLTHMCDMTHSYLCDMTRSYTWRDSYMTLKHKNSRNNSFTRVTRLNHVRDMTHSCVWHVTRLFACRDLHLAHIRINDTTL